MRKFILSVIALVGLCGAAALGNYTMTQGAGTTFGSALVGGVQYVQMFICDLTTPGQCAAVSAGGAIKVDGTGGTFPVSGTVTANLGTIAGAATAAKQPALGTAGAASTDVLTVQGIASMTPFLTNPGTAANWGVLAQGAATSGQLGQLSLGAVTTAAPSYSNGNSNPLSLDTAGNLRVNVVAGGAGGGAVTIASGAVASGAYSAGSIAAGALVAGALVDGADVTEGAKADAVCGTATGTCSVVALLKFLNTGVTSAIPAGTNLIGKVGIDQTTPGTTNAVSATNFPASVSTGTGAQGASSPRVTVATDTATVAGSATLPTGTNTIGSVKQTDGTTVVVTDPCQGSTKSYLPITATTSLVKVIATGVSAKKIYICQLLLTVTAADNVAVFEATTGTTCATSPVAVFGAGTSVATAANGFPFPANGGVSLGMGGFSIAQTTVNNNDLCIGTSAATPLTGGITYVTQ